jgi:hypothetical protein
LATGREQLFCDQHSERRSDDAADDADGLAGQREGVEVGVITGPAFEGLRQAGLA